MYIQGCFKSSMPLNCPFDPWPKILWPYCFSQSPTPSTHEKRVVQLAFGIIKRVWKLLPPASLQRQLICSPIFLILNDLDASVVPGSDGIPHINQETPLVADFSFRPQLGIIYLVVGYFSRIIPIRWRSNIIEIVDMIVLILVIIPFKNPPQPFRYQWVPHV